MIVVAALALALLRAIQTIKVGAGSRAKRAARAAFPTSVFRPGPAARSRRVIRDVLPGRALRRLRAAIPIVGWEGRAQPSKSPVLPGFGEVTNHSTGARLQT